MIFFTLTRTGIEGRIDAVFGIKKEIQAKRVWQRLTTGRKNQQCEVKKLSPKTDWTPESTGYSDRTKGRRR